VDWIQHLVILNIPHHLVVDVVSVLCGDFTPCQCSTYSVFVKYFSLLFIFLSRGAEALGQLLPVRGVIFNFDSSRVKPGVPLSYGRRRAFTVYPTSIKKPVRMSVPCLLNARLVRLELKRVPCAKLQSLLNLLSRFSGRGTQGLVSPELEGSFFNNGLLERILGPY